VPHDALDLLAKPKFTRGNSPPKPARATQGLHVVPVVPNFANGTAATPPPRFVRGDRLPDPPRSGLVKKGDAEPFIKPPSRAKLMVGR
jgi:hypothetical protein